MVEKACPKCKIITEEKECPICKTSKLSTRWYGLLIVLEEDSEINREMSIKPGRYALKVK